MPRIAGLWSALTRAMEDDANAAQAELARKSVCALRLQAAQATLDDFPAPREATAV